MTKKRAKKRRDASTQDGADTNFRTVARNRRATYDYNILERYEAGIALTGTEIKALRQGKASIAEAYVRPKNGELWLTAANIARYDAGSHQNHEPTRDRKLLLHKREIGALTEAFEQGSLTIIPIHLYITRGLAKLQIGVGRGRKHYDKRHKISARDAAKQMREAVRR